jgi:hypothetical protein
VVLVLKGNVLYLSDSWEVLEVYNMCFISVTTIGIKS